MSLFRRQIEPDPLDQWKDAKVDAQIAESNEREELRQKLCEALGWSDIEHKGPLYSWVGGSPITDRIEPLPPLDANLLATAKAKLLTTDELRKKFVRSLTAETPMKWSEYLVQQLEWALTQSTDVQQAWAILEAIK